jgi:hypothetical protein
MSIGSKHIATFLLGAAAALAAKKYMEMTPEEKEQMISKLKEKANKLKDEAEVMSDKAKDYFEELKKKGGDSLKEHFPDAEELINRLFNKGQSEP